MELSNRIDTARQASRHGELLELHQLPTNQGVPFPEDDAFIAEHLRVAATEPKIHGINPEVFKRMRDIFAELPSGEALQRAQHIFENYFIYKHRTFLTAPGDPKVLQRAFELPTAILRKLIRLQTIRDQTYDPANPFRPEFYPREALAVQSKRIISSSDSDSWGPLSSWLLRHDAEYTALLESTITGNTSIEAYERWLQQVSSEAITTARKLAVAARALAYTGVVLG